jgi:hypothetical protein
MPFRIPVGYGALNSMLRDPVLSELEDYVRWLENELTVARMALMQKVPKHTLLTPTIQSTPPATAMARAGGKARAAKLTPEERSKQAKNAARARWRKKLAEDKEDGIDMNTVDPVPKGE